MGKLEGKTAWVSGANKGIGEGVARLFAVEGARVAMVGRTIEEGDRITRQIKDAGGEAIFIQCDVTCENQIKASVAETVSRYGSLDILINNAGTVGVKMLHEYSSDEWDYLMNLNVKSMFLSFKYAFEHLSRNERSYIVNIGSISSFVGQDMTPVYTASKGAVLSLTKSIGLDYARYGIRCNCVCPGITDTPLLRSHLNTEKDPEEHYRKRLGRVPMNIPLYPIDIAKACLYFSCEDSAGVTATSLIVDGGYLACAEWDAAKHL